MANNSITTGKSIDYVAKDFDSTVDALISFATTNYGPGTTSNRLWTNFNTDSFSRNWLEIVAYVTDMLAFYFDVQATQAYLQTATVRSAVKDIAAQFGFTPATATSASGLVTFGVNGAGTIPRGFRVRSTTGIEYYLTTSVVATVAGNYTGNVLQGRIFTEQFVAKGTQNEEFNLAGLDIVRDLTNTNAADISPQVAVAGTKYTLVNTFIRSNGTDTNAVVDSLGKVIGGGGRVYSLGERPNGKKFVRFGDGLFGRKLVPGELISITYRTGAGSNGNIAEETITSADSSPIVISVTNSAAFSGGTDEQSIEQLRELVPASLRTLDRAVAESDYSELLEVNFTEVAKASTEHNTLDPGIDLNVYVVPVGNTITKITDNPPLRNKLTAFLERRKMVTVQFTILDAFGMDFLLGLRVFLDDTTKKTTVLNSINTALSNYFNLTTGGVNGTGIDFAEHVLTEEIETLIKDIPGVDRFEFTKHSYRPRVDSRVLGLATSYTNSEVEIFPNVTESEWLLAATGPDTEASGVLLFSNTLANAYTYNSGTGLIQYSSPIDALINVAPGDSFRDDSGSDFEILAVDSENYNVSLDTGLTIDTTLSSANSGSIRTGGATFETFKCFKKINAVATNLSVNSITDSSLDLTIKTGVGNSLSSRVLLDNSQVFVTNQWATGDYYLVDAASNIWEIVANTTNTIKTAITAVNDASVNTVSPGDYKIVTKLQNKEIVFNNSIFTIQYNSEKTLFSIGAQFNNIGTIGDAFQISFVQTNTGIIGVPIDIVSYDSLTKTVILNNEPELNGVEGSWNLIDNSGQVFNIVGADNRADPATLYNNSNQNTSFILEDSGLGVKYAQGFEAPITSVYSLVSVNLRKSGAVVGSLIAQIVEDDGTGLPDLSTVVATSIPVNLASLATLSSFTSVTQIPNTGFIKVGFTFAVPPTLTAATQYHLVLNGDTAYSISQADQVKTYDNSGSVAYTYGVLDGIIQYSSAVNLSAVLAGDYFRDGSGAVYIISEVSDINNRVILNAGLTIDNTINTDSGTIYRKNNVYVSADSTSPSYAFGVASRYDGSFWANDTTGPAPNRFPTETVFPFSVEGPKSIIIDSNLEPTLGPGGTLSKRYYDDNNEISVILGLAEGLITFAANVNAAGRGTVSGNPNSRVDTFVFRTSPYIKDVVNLRANEIPQYDPTKAIIDIIGGAE